MNTQSKTFCILPWIHIYANADGNVLPCCIANHNSSLGNFRNNSLEEIWNGSQYKQLRKNMLEGKQCSECTACYETEAKGIQSFRQSSNTDYANHLSLVNSTNADGSLDQINLKYFDIRWSNICNFKCRSCSGTYSSSLAKEENRDKIFIFAGGNSNDLLYEQFMPYFKDIEHFYFAGGEPLLTDKHYDILNYLVSIGKTDVKLSYNSNISNLYFKKSSITELWNKFSNVQVRASIDSWGSRAEYIRDGTNWSVIENNIKEIRQRSPHVSLQTNSVISVFNIFTLPDFIEYLLEKELFDAETFEPSFYNIINPEFYSAQVIPDYLKNHIIEKLESTKFTTEIDNRILETISYLKASSYNEDLHRKFIQNTNYFDSIRGQNFVKTFPELNELYRI